MGMSISSQLPFVFAFAFIFKSFTIRSNTEGKGRTAADETERTAVIIGTMDDDELDLLRQQQVLVQQQLNTEERLKLILILERKYAECPFRTKKKIDRLVDAFLEELEDDIHHLLCNMKDDNAPTADDDSDSDSDEYYGLDSDRDTPAEVETVIRLFPRILSRMVIVQGGHGGVRIGCPIHYLSYIINDSMRCFLCNLKALSFIPLLARLAIEFGSYDEHQRGGLLIKDTDPPAQDGRTVLNWLMLSDCSSKTLSYEERTELVDNEYLQVVIQLRRMGLLKKEDIRNYNLISSILYNGGPAGFAERRFCFLVEWDPPSLLQQHSSDEFGDTCSIPLHHAAHNSYIYVFQFVFEYGIRYFPKKKGINLLFKINEDDNTPFQLACDKFGYEVVMNAIEETLTHCYSLSVDDSPPLNVVEALIMAAIDENIHLDCVYFLLRRQPDVLIKPLSRSIITNNNNGNDNDSYVGDGDCGDDAGGNNRKNDDKGESVGDSDEYDGNDTGIRDNANQDDSNAAVKRNHSANGNGNYVDKEEEDGGGVCNNDNGEYLMTNVNEIANSSIDRKRKREIQNERT
jgi:hypothetical protein